MARFKVYLKTFNGAQIYEDSFTEITRDVVKLSPISQAIDNNDFDVGVIRNSGFSMVVNNSSGKFSNVGTLRSIFPYKIKNSIIRITWDARDHDLICGFFKCGEEILGGEELAFEGILEEITSESKIDDQNVTFRVLGYEAMIDGLETPYASISNGDLFSEALFKALDQSPLRDVIYIDNSNINLGVDLAIDTKEPWENTRVGDVLGELFLGANSVLYIEKPDFETTPRVIAKNRIASIENKFTFYGQASIRGVENILNVPKLRTGLNRTFNYWKWKESSLLRKDESSIELYGAREKEIGLDVIDIGSTAKIESILVANRNEFAFPKVELEVETPIWYSTLGLHILDRVNIDYPTIFTPSDNNPLPRYDQGGRYGEVVYPQGQYSLTIDSSRSFKILSKKIDPAKQAITFGLREI